MIRLPVFNKFGKTPVKFLTISIDSSCIKCLAFFQDNGTSKIIGSGHQNLEPGSFRGGLIVDDESVAACLDLAIEKATENIEENIDNVIFGLNGNVCLGLMTTIRSKRGTFEPISKQELDVLYKKTSEAAVMQAQNEYLSITGNTDIPLESITFSTAYSKIDGKLMDNLISKSGKLIELAVFNSFSPRYIISSIQKAAKMNRLKILAMGSELYTITKTILNKGGEKDFVLIDVENDSTNVAVVFSENIVITKTLDVGNAHFIEGVSEHMGLTFREGEKMLKTHLSGHLTQSEGAIVQRSLQDTLDIWINGLELLFSEFTGVKTFAPTIYLSGIGADLPDLMDSIKNEPWTKSIPFKSPPEFKKVSFIDLDDIADSTGKINNSEWVPAASLSKIYTEMIGAQS